MKVSQFCAKFNCCPGGMKGNSFFLKIFLTDIMQHMLERKFASGQYQDEDVEKLDLSNYGRK